MHNFRVVNINPFQMKLYSTKSIFILILLVGNCGLLKAQSAYVPPALPAIPERSFNIKDFGAAGDGATDNAGAIQSAINAADKAGGGRVVIPAGIYLCGPFHLVNNLELHLDADAILKMLPIDKYPGGIVTGTDFISGAKLHDIAISGKGTIDGQGSPWWPYAKTNGAKRPRMIELKDCDKILIEDVKLMNSPMFHIAISGKSSNVTVRNIIVRAPASTDPVNPSHNTDACDVTGHKILVQHCDISVGDDNYTCSGGTSDVLITDCTYGYGHGVSIGSKTNGGISNITVQNCSFTNTESGIRIKSDRDRGALIKNLTYSNLKMTNVGIPILIYCSYDAKEKEYRNLQKLTAAIAENYPSAPVTALTPVIQDVTFKDITATVKGGNRAGLIWGLPEAAISNVLMQNVTIHADNAFGIYFADKVKLVDCKIVTSEGSNRLSLTHAQVNVDGKEVN